MPREKGPREKGQLPLQWHIPAKRPRLSHEPAEDEHMNMKTSPKLVTSDLITIDPVTPEVKPAKSKRPKTKTPQPSSSSQSNTPGSAKTPKLNKPTSSALTTPNHTSSQLTTPNSALSHLTTPDEVPESKKKKKAKRPKPKVDPSATFEDAFPILFLPLTRANVLIIAQNPMTASYRWKDDVPAVSHEEFKKMKAILSDDIAQHFISFGTAKCGCWAIKNRFPSINTSSKVFNDLRRYFLRGIADIKHEYLYDRLFTFLYFARIQYPEIINMSETEIMKFFGPRFDIPLTEMIWGVCLRVLDLNATFRDAEAPGAWYMRQVFLNSCAKLMPLIASEVALNPDLQWGKTVRAPSGWMIDREGREEVNKLFDAFSIAPEFSDVELDSFKWAESGSRISAESTPSRSR